MNLSMSTISHGTGHCPQLCSDLLGACARAGTALAPGVSIALQASQLGDPGCSPAPCAPSAARIPWPTVNLARGTSKKSTQPVILSEARQASDKQVHVVNVEAFILAHISDSADKMVAY